MYRIIELSGTYYAVELLTSGRNAQDEFDEMEQFTCEGTNCIITDDYSDFVDELTVRDYI